MKRKIQVVLLVLMTAIFITLLIIPANLSSAIIKDGSTMYIKGKPACNCTGGGNDCYCIVNSHEED